jgi:Domain of unknown function (DUF6265)
MRVASMSLLVACAVFSSTRGAEPAAYKIDSVSWLVGKWQSAAGERLACEEHWSAPAGEAMVGMFRMLAGQRPSLYELLLLEEDAEGVWMRLRHFNPQMVAREQEPIKMKLVSATGEKLVFENLANNLPKRVVYTLSGNELAATVETERDGKAVSFALKMQRAK